MVDNNKIIRGIQLIILVVLIVTAFLFIELSKVEGKSLCLLATRSVENCHITK